MATTNMPALYPYILATLRIMGSREFGWDEVSPGDARWALELAEMYDRTTDTPANKQEDWHRRIRELLGLDVREQIPWPQC
jgi:hypothetical protein